MGSWHEGSGSPAKSKARGSIKITQKIKITEREREIDSWVCGAKALGRRQSQRLVGRSKSHKKSKSHRERDCFVGSWHEGFGSPAKLKARGSKALGRRLVHGFLDRWVEGSGTKIGSCVRRSAKSKA